MREQSLAPHKDNRTIHEQNITTTRHTNRAPRHTDKQDVSNIRRGAGPRARRQLPPGGALRLRWTPFRRGCTVASRAHVRVAAASRRSGATPSTLHPTPYTLHPTPYTLQPLPSTLRPKPYTLHPTPHTLNPTPYIRNRAPCSRNPQPSTLNPHPSPPRWPSGSRTTSKSYPPSS